MADKDLFGQMGSQYGQMDSQYGQMGGQYGQMGGQMEQRMRFGREAPLLRVIEGEHAEFLTALRMVQQADVSTQRRLFPIVIRTLLAHVQAEEEELHGLVDGVARVQASRTLARQQHGQIERLINRLSALPYGTSAWNQTMDELVSTFRNNIRLEEREVFPLIRASFNVDQLEGAERRYIARKMRALLALLG